MSSKLQRKGRPRKRKGVSLPPPLGGDHGTGTEAANANTELLPMKGADGKNPNNMGRRQKINVLKRLMDEGRLSMRQWQAGNAIATAYGHVQSLSSGGPLKEWVQSDPKPDAAIEMQVAKTSALVHVMKGVKRTDRALVEAVCWHNQPLHTLNIRRCGNRLRDALDLVADHLRY